MKPSPIRKRTKDPGLRTQDDTEEEDTVWRKIPLDGRTRSHFGLGADPFAQGPQSRDEVYVPPSWRRLQPAIMSAPNHQALVVVVGPSTGGKTTFLDWIAAGAPEDVQIIQPRYVDRRKFNTSYLYEVMLRELGICEGARIPGSVARRHQLLEEGLLKAAQDERRVALLVDDAHRLKDEDLMNVKGWVEMRAGFRRLLGVVLVGQEELAGLLRGEKFRAIRSRAQIVRWPRFERYAAEFLEHRLATAGARFGAVFAPEAAQAIVARVQQTYHGDHEVTPAEIEACAVLAMRSAARAGDDRVTPKLVRSLAVEQLVQRIHEDEPAASRGDGRALAAAAG